MFAYTPLISGDWMQILQVGFFALFGIYAINSIIQLYAEGPLSVITGPMMAFGVVCCFWPMHLVANLIGAATVILAIVLSQRKLRAQQLA